MEVRLTLIQAPKSHCLPDHSANHNHAIFHLKQLALEMSKTSSLAVALHGLSRARVNAASNYKYVVTQILG